MSPRMTTSPQRNRPMNSAERLVPVPLMSASGVPLLEHVRFDGEVEPVMGPTGR
jgi:hypothetical protein